MSANRVSETSDESTANTSDALGFVPNVARRSSVIDNVIMYYCTHVQNNGCGKLCRLLRQALGSAKGLAFYRPDHTEPRHD